MAKKKRGLQGSMYDAVIETEPVQSSSRVANYSKNNEWVVILISSFIFATVASFLVMRYV